MSIFGWTHIGLGVMTLVAGLAALVFSKGSRLHRYSGRVFAGGVLFTAGGGAVYAGFGQLITLLVGITCCYLVITALITVWPRHNYSRKVDMATLALSLSLALTFLVSGLRAPAEAHLPSNTIITPEVYFFFAGITALLVIGDVLNLYFEGFSDKWRRARHLWRMGFALYIVAGSSTRAFPESLKASPWLDRSVELLAIIIAVWWLYTITPGIKTWLCRRKLKQPQPSVSPPVM